MVQLYVEGICCQPVSFKEANMKYCEMVMGLKLVGLKMTTVWICNNPIIQTSSYHMFNP